MNARVWRVTLLAWPLAELVALWAVAQWLGWGWALLLLIAGSVLGLAVLRRAGAALARHAALAASQGRSLAPEPVVRVAAGLLLAIPGFLTDIVGLVLLVPPVTAIVGDHAGTWVSRRIAVWRVPGMGTTGDIIRGTVIHPEDDSGFRGPRGELPG